jgi:uncharacterized membrane protein YeaQ/YmgE (transglycosylase-associated protein family)
MWRSEERASRQEHHPMEYVYPLVIGLVAGWIANMLLGGKGGLVRTLIIGLLGAVLGGILVPELGISLTHNVHLNNVITASIGAVVLLFLAQFIGGGKG